MAQKAVQNSYLTPATDLLLPVSAWQIVSTYTHLYYNKHLQILNLIFTSLLELNNQLYLRDRKVPLIGYTDIKRVDGHNRAQDQMETWRIRLK